MNREFCEDGEVISWRAIGHREGRCKGRIGGGDYKVEDMILLWVGKFTLNNNALLRC